MYLGGSYDMINCTGAGDSVLDIEKDSVPDELHPLAGQFGGKFPRIS
jgi:hypothetical protein